MKIRHATYAQKLLNLYRQAHVIIGGWRTVNAIFINESSKEVIDELVKLPNGTKLAEHIDNLKSGVTPPDSIARDLLPYGGAFADYVFNVKINNDEISDIESALNSFTPDADGLAKIKSLPAVQKFGDEWEIGIRQELSSRPDLLEKWKVVERTARAHELWHIAMWALSEPQSERTRARIQADLSEYETYLPMFGDAGSELLSKLRMLVTSK